MVAVPALVVVDSCLGQCKRGGKNCIASQYFSVLFLLIPHARIFRSWGCKANVQSYVKGQETGAHSARGEGWLGKSEKFSSPIVRRVCLFWFCF